MSEPRKRHCQPLSLLSPSTWLKNQPVLSFPFGVLFVK
uniref:Uncharacterized protein n=1 Tax=Arundo donax TaxID=35708 RepID=A0A0A9CD13_ARUDO